ncbi:MAG: hypothetical protein QNJ49_03835 [Mastigocoleus sp. MO_167.B18]|uniref:hypothetical protein n=1 Tax=Mastigocoleus sp. MO_188.B34 TaxID=3036635 RepID=UPI0026271C2B|nr:hypothetical protein [Mastigocoleus sp. MO_188.B34]MDJ0693818.1 hypothetical protein [Mastigocoleus sp. MO_188.B34]MDJ0772550.1 hypothetical protein [Mastigocoleus sp. MO_167.B18]
MGRWTPLVLMAGGLAILLGTLLGISFPMDGRNAQGPKTSDKESSVLPANINVNSTTAKQSSGNANNGSTVAQKPSSTDPSVEVSQNNNTSGTQQNQESNQTTIQDGSAQGNGEGNDGGVSGDGNGEVTNGGDNSEPIRALW